MGKKQRYVLRPLLFMIIIYKAVKLQKKDEESESRIYIGDLYWILITGEFGDRHIRVIIRRYHGNSTRKSRGLSV